LATDFGVVGRQLAHPRSVEVLPRSQPERTHVLMTP
jgi:hypothetical protein